MDVVVIGGGILLIDEVSRIGGVSGDPSNLMLHSECLRKSLADAVTQQLRTILLSCGIQPHTFLPSRSVRTDP
jgi:hypothetical protein